MLDRIPCATRNREIIVSFSPCLFPAAAIPPNGQPQRWLSSVIPQEILGISRLAPSKSNNPGIERPVASQKTLAIGRIPTSQASRRRFFPAGRNSCHSRALNIFEQLASLRQRFNCSCKISHGFPQAEPSSQFRVRTPSFSRLWLAFPALPKIFGKPYRGISFRNMIASALPTHSDKRFHSNTAFGCERAFCEVAEKFLYASSAGNLLYQS